MVRISRVSSIILVALLAGVAPGKPDKRETEPDAAVTKLITELHSSNFRMRQEASEALEKLGVSVLPALRKTLKTATEVETKRRLEHVIGRIENVVFQAEEKRWKDLDTGRLSIKDRLAMIQGKTPTLSDPQVISAIYLITVGRAPTEDEMKRAREQFAESQSRSGIMLRVALKLVQSKEYSPGLADINLRMIKAQKEVANEGSLAKALHKLNSPEFEKLVTDGAAATSKVAMTNEQLVDVAFLLTMSRYPDEAQVKSMVAHFQRTKDRARATQDMYWALMNTKEFVISK